MISKTSFTYHVYSDDRDSKTVERRIQPALESGSALGATKPVLVVIDEIDGATGGSDEVRPFS